MSNPNIDNIVPSISLSIGQTVPLLLASVALEELALAHIMNAEAEKLQFVLGTITPPPATTLSPPVVSLTNLLDVNTGVQRTMRDVIKKEMLLEFKFENILDLIALTPGSITPTPPAAFCVCAVRYNISNDVFTLAGDGSAASDLQRRMGDGLDGRGDICETGVGSCNPAIRDLFGFNFPRTSPTFTFLADQYTLNPDGSVGTCAETPLGLSFTITGTGTLNGTPGHIFTLTLIDGGGSNMDSAILSIPDAALVFTAIQTLNPGHVMVRMC